MNPTRLGLLRSVQTITILSPHPDDAAFSLCLSIWKWSWLGIRIRIINVFTRSTYAPQAALDEDKRDGVEEVTRLRVREDRAALFRIHPGLIVDSLPFWDAPLRLGIDAKMVCSEAARSIQDPGTCTQLNEALLRKGRQTFVVAPLALGDHVDHLAVRTAAIAVRDEFQALAFYEDLPYRMWTSEQALQEHVQEIERRTGMRLRPRMIGTDHGFWMKKRIVAQYCSQITAREAEAIARNANHYGGRERIWASLSALRRLP
jgi:LmbE family N-acetylglucosaminyl deacetylase